MYIKQSAASIILILSIVLVCLSCNKHDVVATAAVPTSVYANIDSIAGVYTGVTSGDSVYTYTDSTGQLKQWVRSFSLLDTLTVTSPDTLTIVVASKFYNASFAYNVYNTVTSVNVNTDVYTIETVLQTMQAGTSVSLSDSTDGLNHLIVNLANGQKSATSNVTLLNR